MSYSFVAKRCESIGRSNRGVNNFDDLPEKRRVATVIRASIIDNSIETKTIGGIAIEE
jgi:hypothetical protein